MANDTPKKEPTSAEANFFFSIIRHMKNKADIDWNGVAADLNFKSAEVARVRFGQVKRKYGISNDAPSTPKSAGPTPAKVTKSTGRSGAKKGKAAASSTPSRVKAEEDAQEMMRAMHDDDEEEPPSGNFIVKRELMEEDEKKFGGGLGLMSDADPF